MEKNYDFRKRLLQVHRPNVTDYSKAKSFVGCRVDETWEIVFPSASNKIYKYVSHDLKDYFEVSHGLSLCVREYSDVENELNNQEKKIILTDETIAPGISPSCREPMAYRLMSNDGIVICGNTPRATAQGCYFLEDSMNLNRVPGIEACDISKAALFSPRMVHSGYKMDVFPDEHLKAIAHSGMDAILLFVKGINQTPHGYEDFNNLIERAENFGIDVYAYSYYRSRKHPDDVDAREHYESTYGELFKKCPKFKGVVLVGESMEFPSKDSHTTGRPHYENTPENNPEGKPSPGWYPCYDYPEWINMVKDVIREKNKNADIVFWTYNWGYVNEEARIKLIRSLPTDISLLATFEMFEEFKVSENIINKTTDYTLSFEGPGGYFLSEAKEAAKRNIRLYAMTNTGGLTWDIGVIPFEPAPYQWKLRYDNIIKAHNEYGLCGLMESHHYGFYPSFISELAKNAFWKPACDFDELLLKIAERDYGEPNAASVVDALRFYSEGIRHYISTNEDQYGPFRIGPSYPLLFRKTAVLQSIPEAHFGKNRICNTMYTYDVSKLGKLNYEIQSLTTMRDCYKNGNDIMEKVLENAEDEHKDAAKRLLYLGRFIENSVITTINVKLWYLNKIKLIPDFSIKKIWEGGTPNGEADDNKQSAALSREEAEIIVSEMMEIAKRENLNALETVRLVEYDSRLGYEPSMEYMCDAEHLYWKIEKTNEAVSELQDFLKNL